MNITTTKALVSTQNFIPLHESAKKVAVCLDLYPKRYGSKVVFTIRKPDESDGNYTPNGRKLVKPNYTHSIDIYV
ncbi:MAG: hypothetical protein V3S16_00470 [Candidatus Desulfatibia sp.]|uniref:hypothetical protein n=1 Tax=Candidatus Desulfatibia sp. TaxID=3101189 RepID=UPI002F2FA27F